MAPPEFGFCPISANAPRIHRSSNRTFYPLNSDTQSSVHDAVLGTFGKQVSLLPYISQARRSDLQHPLQELRLPEPR
jgi:hypothetical protein